MESSKTVQHPNQNLRRERRSSVVNPVDDLTTDEESGIITLDDLVSSAEVDEIFAALEEQLGISSSGYPQSTASSSGYTLDSTLIANTVVITVRALAAAGVIDVTRTNIIEGTGLGAHTATDYKAVFNDRNREFFITEETYRAITEQVEPRNEELSEEGIDAAATSIEPIVQDRMSSLESALDGRGNTKPFSEDTRWPAHRQGES